MADPKKQSNHSLSVSHLFIHSVVILLALAILINPAASKPSDQTPLQPKPTEQQQLEFCRANKDEAISHYFAALVDSTIKAPISLVHCMEKMMWEKRRWLQAKAWGRIGDKDLGRRYGVSINYVAEVLEGHEEELEKDDRDAFWTAATYIFFEGLKYNEKMWTSPMKKIVRRALDSRFGSWFDYYADAVMKADKALEGYDKRHQKNYQQAMEAFWGMLGWLGNRGKFGSESRMVNHALLKNIFNSRTLTP